MGQTDGALDRMDGALAANMDLEGTGGQAGALSGTAIGGDFTEHQLPPYQQ